MRVHVVNVMRPDAGVSGGTLERFSEFARRVEALGFDGLWVNDSFGRGNATIDPIVLMTVIGMVTDRIDVGSAVLQVPVRHPVELAHRVQGLHAMIGARLRLGVGSGSTQADFDLVGADFTTRFKALTPALDTMRRAWRGEALPGGRLTPWPGTDGGPEILLGAWRNRRWITYAAEQCAGWIASGYVSRVEDLEAGMKIFREAGGKRALLGNVIVDLHGDGSDVLASCTCERCARRGGTVMLTGGETAARRQLQWIRNVGFDDVLCLARPDSLDDLARLRDAF